MTAVDITRLYDTLRTRISVHAPTGCLAISLKLSPELTDELAFYRLVFWGYALVHEAARTSFSFLTRMEPLKADRMLRQETSNLRTFLAHNMDRENRRHRKIYDFVHRWFGEACGERNPDAIAAALLLLSDAQRVGTLTPPQIIDLINSSVP